MTGRRSRDTVRNIAYSPDNQCFACGAGNPHGLHLHFVEEDGVVSAEFVPQSWQEGWQGVVHGGIITTLLDEAMAYCIFFAGESGVTARLDVRFRTAAHAGDCLRVEARIARQVRQIVDTQATVFRGEEVVAEATARFLKTGALSVAGTNTTTA